MTDMPLRRGVHAALEQEADRIIRESLQGVYRHADKSDILTAWKIKERSRHEMFVPTGTPEPSVRQGIFHRALNPEMPHLNSQDRSGRRSRRIPTSMSDFVQEQQAISAAAEPERSGWDDVG
jgi:hypothetical protein